MPYIIISKRNKTDTAPGVSDRHIDVYTGEGKVAQTNTLKITGQEKTVCFALEPNILSNNNAPNIISNNRDHKQLLLKDVFALVLSP